MPDKRFSFTKQIVLVNKRTGHEILVAQFTRDAGWCWKPSIDCVDEAFVAAEAGLPLPFAGPDMDWVLEYRDV